MQDVKCEKCSKKLFKMNIVYEKSNNSHFVEIKCPRCGKINLVQLGRNHGAPLESYIPREP